MVEGEEWANAGWRRGYWWCSEDGRLETMMADFGMCDTDWSRQIKEHEKAKKEAAAGSA